jgi:hypothetical protein
LGSFESIFKAGLADRAAWVMGMRCRFADRENLLDYCQTCGFFTVNGCIKDTAAHLAVYRQPPDKKRIKEEERACSSILTK